MAGGDDKATQKAEKDFKAALGKEAKSYTPQALEKAFGQGVKDLEAIRPHLRDSAAKASKMVGNAFSQASKVSFKNAKNIETVAHEAAHTVQQASHKALDDAEKAVGKGKEVAKDDAKAVARNIASVKKQIEAFAKDAVKKVKAASK